MSAPDVMLGKWRLVKSENFDEYLKACGAGMMSRGMAATESTAGTWCVEIKKLTDDMFNMKTSTVTKSAEISFKLDGKEVEEITGDGRRCMTTMTWDDGTLYQKRKGLDNSKGGEIIRKFQGDEMDMTCKVDDVECKRVYHRDESCRV